MKHFRLVALGLFALAGAHVFAAHTAAAAEIATGEPDRTLSPYFHVQSEGTTDGLPLKKTTADVHVSGVIAHVKVRQVYQNTGKTPIEAVYVFPGSTRSAVFGMRMKIGERIVEAEIEKKKVAREIYEKAKSEGKSASLLEQKRPNVFQMNVANILPGDTIEVELDYVEAMVPNGGIYEFVYPTVVGPRYSEKSAIENPDETWIENPHLRSGEAPPYVWDLKATVDAGMAIEKFTSPSHAIVPVFASKSHASIDMEDPQGGNRDFVLRYRLAGGKVSTGLLLYPGKKENFFLAMVQPPARVSKEIRPPREYIFILDVSGSMHGFPLETGKAVLRNLLDGMGPKDRFNMMMFSGGSTVLAEQSLPVTKANVERANQFLTQQRGGGGTQILAALKRALAMKRSKKMSTSFVVVTDGYVAVERETFDLIRDNLGEANLFAFGIGSSVNRHLIEGMARSGMGEPFVVLNQAQADATAKKFQRYIESPVLTDIKVAFKGFDAYDVVPKTVPDVFAERPILVFGKYRGQAKGGIRVTGQNGQGRFVQTLDVAASKSGANKNQALQYLWARHRIEELDDQRRVGHAPELEDQITELGLRYNLMTEFTSFVAVDKQIRNKSGKLVTVRQPLPMPKGVSDAAIGGSVGSVGYGGYGRGAAAPSRRVMRKPRPAPPMTSGTVSTKQAEESLADLDDARDRSTRDVRSRLNTLRRQILGHFANAGGIKGTIRFRITIAANGRVTNVKVLSSTLSKPARDHVIRELKKLRVSRGSAQTITTALTF